MVMENKIFLKSTRLQKTGPNHYGQVTAEPYANELIMPVSQSCWQGWVTGAKAMPPPPTPPHPEKKRESNQEVLQNPFLINV